MEVWTEQTQSLPGAALFLKTFALKTINAQIKMSHFSCSLLSGFHIRPVHESSWPLPFSTLPRPLRSSSTSSTRQQVSLHLFKPDFSAFYVKTQCKIIPSFFFFTITSAFAVEILKRATVACLLLFRFYYMCYTYMYLDLNNHVISLCHI